MKIVPALVVLSRLLAQFGNWSALSFERTGKERISSLLDGIPGSGIERLHLVVERGNSVEQARYVAKAWSFDVPLFEPPSLLRCPLYASIPRSRARWDSCTNIGFPLSQQGSIKYDIRDVENEALQERSLCSHASQGYTRSLLPESGQPDLVGSCPYRKLSTTQDKDTISYIMQSVSCEQRQFCSMPCIHIHIYVYIYIR